MAEWKRCTLADLGEIVGGATPSTKNESYYGGDVAWITPKDLSTFQGRYISRGERNITNEGLRNSSARLMPPHSVLFTSRAPIGYVAIAQNEVCTNQGFKSIVPNGGTDYLFLYYLLVNNCDRIENMGSGTTFKEVSGSVMKQIEVDVPVDKAEQAAIARILGALDDKIENNTKINNHLEQMAQVAFAQLLIDDAFDEPMVTLSDIAEINPLRSLSRGQEAVYIEMSNLPTHSSFPTDWVMRPFLGGMKFANGDTIMARITPCLENGKTAYINFLEEGTVAFGSTEYIVITSKPGYCNEMFYYLARYPDFVNYAVRNMNGSSGRQRISGETIGRYELHIPRTESIRTFAEIAIPIMETIRQNALESRKLTVLRDTLLPRLLSGELSVADLGGRPACRQTAK
jgi:type I restriction enzyme S subunit